MYVSPARIVQLIRQFALPLLALLLVGGCASVTSSQPVPVARDARWAVLSMENLSTTAQAGAQAEALLEAKLRSRGVARINRWQRSQKVSLGELLDPGREREAAERWARQEGYDYAISGAVNEWHYRGAPDSEAVVGIALTLIDLRSGDVLWQGTASQTGFAYASVSTVADRIFDRLLDRIELTSTPVAGQHAAALALSLP